MSKRDKWSFRVKHMIRAIENIQEYTKEMNVEGFIKNHMVQDAVARNLEILGEAVKHIPAWYRHKHEGIAWEDLSMMRNFIIHQYDDVDEFALWMTVKKDLSPLLAQLRDLREQKND